MPHWIEPMLATEAKSPFSRPGWFFEVKWDGFRAIAKTETGSASLRSRTNKPFTPPFTLITDQLRGLSRDSILDGEIVMLYEDGKADFEALRRRSTRNRVLVYYIFDLLFIDGYDIRTLPLRERKNILQDVLLPNLPNIRLCQYLEEDGEAFFRAIVEAGVEGMVGKNAQSHYKSGRSRDWLKVKHYIRHGWTKQITRN